MAVLIGTGVIVLGAGWLFASAATYGGSLSQRRRIGTRTPKA